MNLKDIKMITYSYRKIIEITLPLILGLVIQTLIGTTDTIFLGHVGEVELGASAIGGLIYLVIFMIEKAFITGAQILMSQYNGCGKHQLKNIGKVFWVTNNIVMIISIVAVTLVALSAKSVLWLMVQNEILQIAILAYCVPRCFGLFFSGIKSMLEGFLVAINVTKHIAVSSIILLVCNIIFDWWFIFGGMGIEPLGLKGAAYASVLAEMIAAIYLAFYVVVKINWHKFGFNKFTLSDAKIFKLIMSKANYLMVLNLFSWGSWLYFYVEVEKLGVEALAISNVVKSLYTILCIAANALAIATISISGNLIGAKKYDEVLPTLARIIKFGAIPFASIFLLLALFPKQFLGIFTNDITLINDAVKPLYVMLIANAIVLPEYVYFYALYGADKIKTAFIIEMSSLAVYVGTTRIIVGIDNAEVAWCYYADLLYHLVSLPISYWYMKREKWIEK